MIKAQVVADSISPQGIRLFSVRADYPWFIHGEVMTHRVLSRNASSNRAIPLAKMLAEARSDELRAEPVFWGAEQKGMSPGGELPSKFDTPAGNSYKCIEHAQERWKEAAENAAHSAEILGRIGLHKSLCNRLLMPFTHAHVLLTGTEWMNFFGLRLAADADPTMRALAEAVWREWNESEPTKLGPGQWHLPFVDVGDILSDDCKAMANWMSKNENQELQFHKLAIYVSVARCARVSYETFETGKRSTVEADLRLYEQLSKNGHWSPFEHQATPDYRNDASMEPWAHVCEHGNFRGFRQYRKMMPGEAVRPLPELYHAQTRSGL